jgi:hypothetical protein
MNCQQCQRRILAAEQVDHAVLAVEAHLAQCESCRQFRRELVRVEANIPFVPVPASGGKERLIQMILTNPQAARSAGAAANDSGVLLARLEATGRRPGYRDPGTESRPWPALALAAFTRQIGNIPHKVAIATASAAALILCGVWLGSWLGSSGGGDSAASQSPADQADAPQPGQSKPAAAWQNKSTLASGERGLAGRLLDCDLKLAEAQKPRQRLEILIELADVLHFETRMLAKAAPPARLDHLAGLYDRVLEEGIAAAARELPIEERKLVLAKAADQAAKKRLQGGDVGGSAAGKERWRQLEADIDLIETLVDGGLNLAAESDPLRRADYCNRLVDGVAREIKKAVQQRDSTRVAQLGEQMQRLLVRGVAGNLNLARASMTPNSPRNTEIARLGAEVAGVTKAFEDELAGDPALDPEIMGPTLKGVAQARSEVDLAVHGKSGKQKKGRS